MNWLGMSPLAATALWFAAAAAALWLYLHTRRPLRRRVSTLRFWSGVQPIAQPLRRYLREPWALLAQLLFLLLLIFALANPRWGTTSAGRSAVIVMDTSIWSQARPAGGAPWMDKVRQETQRLVDALPAGDPVLLLSAQADAPPILPFTTDRAALRRAIAGTPASNGVADVPRALDSGKAALTGATSGVLVYVGPGMLDDQQAQKFKEFQSAMETAVDGNQFLVRLVGADTPVVNRGITRLSLRRDTVQPDRWHLLTQVKNYNDAKASVGLKLLLDGQSLGEGMLSLPPNGSANAEDTFVWAAGGVLEAQITTPDALDADNHATINLPPFRPVPVALYSSDFFSANDFLTVLSSNPYLEPEIVFPGKTIKDKPEMAVYQGVTPPDPLVYNSIWFSSGRAEPGAHPLRLTKWNTEHPVTRWVRTQDVGVENPATLKVLPTDTVLAAAEGNPPVPLIVAREANGHKLVMIGFDPRNSNFAQQSAFPLLMAGAVEWMTHSVEETADSVTVGEVDIPGPVTRIIAPSGKDVPFARNGANVHLVAADAGLYRIIGPGGETSLAVNPPELPAQRLAATPRETAALQPGPTEEAGWDLWPWLAFPAIVLLWLEWWLYYSGRKKKQFTESDQQAGGSPAHDPDLGTQKNREPSATRDSNFVTQAGA